MREILCLVAGLLVVVFLLVGGCTVQPTRPSEEEELPPEEKAEPVTMEGPKWFPESDKNFRQLTDSEKEKVIEIALNTPEALRQLEEESTYRTNLSWIAIVWEDSGYSEWWGLDYEVVENGIPAFVSKSAVFYPRVVIDFGEPAQWQVSVAVDLEAEKVVLVEENPARNAPTPP